MKKIFLILFALVAIATVSIFGFIRSLGISDPARLVPASMLIFISTPDLLRTATRWPSTSLAKISEEPEVKDFLKKPLSVISLSQGGRDAGGNVLKVKPRRIFLTLTSFSTEEVRVLLGVQFFGKRKNVEDSFEFIRRKISRGTVTYSRTSTNYNGNTIESVVYKGMTLYSAIQGRWGFLSNNLLTLQETLDRASGKTRHGSLAEDVNFLKVNTHLPSKPDLQIFINSQSTLRALLAVGANMGSVPDSGQVQHLQKLGAIGISSKLDGADMRDSMAIILTHPLTISPLRYTAMKFTSPNTLGYLEMSKAWYEIFGIIPLLFDKFSSFLTQAHLSLGALNQMFGSESALIFSWPTHNLRPHAILVSGIQNQTEALQWLHQANFGPLLPNTKFPNTSFYQLELPQYPLIGPTIAFHDNLLFAGLTASDVEETLLRADSSETLKNSPTFTPALSRYRSKNLLFSFLDAKRLFERTYSMLRPIIIFSAALSPDSMQIIDTSKLPSTESISRHLQPLISTQQLQNDVVVFNSTGPITLDQALLIFLFAKVGMSFSPQQ